MSDKPPLDALTASYVIEVQAIVRVRPQHEHSASGKRPNFPSASALTHDGWPADAVEFGRAVREARKRLDINQLDFADRVGIGLSTLSTIEKGQRPKLRRTLRQWIVAAFASLGISSPPASAADSTP